LKETGAAFRASYLTLTNAHGDGMALDRKKIVICDFDNGIL
jgi:hypothetical protein